MRSEEFEEHLLAWVHTVLEDSCFSLRLRFLALEQFFRMEIACQPSAVINSYYVMGNTTVFQQHNATIRY